MHIQSHNAISRAKCIAFNCAAIDFSTVYNLPCHQRPVPLIPCLHGVGGWRSLESLQVQAWAIFFSSQTSYHQHDITERLLYGIKQRKTNANIFHPGSLHSTHRATGSVVIYVWLGSQLIVGNSHRFSSVHYILELGMNNYGQLNTGSTQMVLSRLQDPMTAEGQGRIANLIRLRAIRRI